MFGPCLGPRRRKSYCALAAAAAVSLLGLCVGQANAQAEPAARSDRQLPDTFDFEPGTRYVDDRDADDRRDDAQDDDVSRLFADGLEDLESGDLSAAQSAFERVIAQDPQGHLAGEARRYLADLYDRARAPAARPAAARAPAFEEKRSALGAADVVLPKAAGPETAADVGSLGVTIAEGVEATFIAEAGDRIFFASGSADLGQRARVVLAAQARWLASHPEVNAVIEGHADDGAISAEQLNALSQQRAAAVRDRLIEEGIPATRLAVVASGRRHPVSDCDGPDCAAQNRRVVTVLKANVRDFGGRALSRAVASEVRRPPTQ